MLKNRRYIGEYSFGEIVLPDSVPVIIPQKLFNRVAARMEKNKRAPARHKAAEEMYRCFAESAAELWREKAAQAKPCGNITITSVAMPSGIKAAIKKRSKKTG